jgi:hypothetical protein
MRILYFFLILVAFQRSLFSGEECDEPCFSEAEKLKGAESFVVFHRVIAFDSSLKEPFREELIKSLREIGIVYLADDTLLTEEQLEEKYTPCQTLMFVNEFSEFETLSDATSTEDLIELPVHKIIVDVNRGEHDIEEEYFRGITWQKKRYISTLCDEKEYNDKAIKNLKAILKDFKNDYQKVNLSEKKPHFFLYE